MHSLRTSWVGRTANAVSGRRGSSLGWLVLPVLVCLACAADGASASPADARGKKKKTRQAKQQPKAAQVAEPKSGFPVAGEKPKSKAPAQAAKKGKGCGGGSSAAEGKRFVDQPGAEKKPSGGKKGPKWVCENAEINLEPVWRGQPLHFPFKIRNGGNEDLRISARGG